MSPELFVLRIELINNYISDMLILWLQMITVVVGDHWVSKFKEKGMLLLKIDFV